MKWLEAVAKRRKQRQNISAFKALMATPAVGAVTLPANARLALRSVAGSVEGDPAATIVGASDRTIHAPDLDAGEMLVLDQVARGAVVTPVAGFELMLDTGLSNFVKIGEGA